MLKCGSSSYFGEHENSRTCLGAHIAFSSAENQGVNQSQMNCLWTISDDTKEMAGSGSQQLLQFPIDFKNWVAKKYIIEMENPNISAHLTQFLTT